LSKPEHEGAFQHEDRGGFNITKLGVEGRTITV